MFTGDAFSRWQHQPNQLDDQDPTEREVDQQRWGAVQRQVEPLILNVSEMKVPLESSAATATYPLPFALLEVTRRPRHFKILPVELVPGSDHRFLNFRASGSMKVPLVSSAATATYPLPFALLEVTRRPPAPFQGPPRWSLARCLRIEVF